MKLTKINKEQYNEVLSIISEYEKKYFEKYTIKKDEYCITILGKELSYPMLKKIEEKTKLIGWGIHPTIKIIDGIDDGVKINLFVTEKDNTTT